MRTTLLLVSPCPEIWLTWGKADKCGHDGRRLAADGQNVHIADGLTPSTHAAGDGNPIDGIGRNGLQQPVNQSQRQRSRLADGRALIATLGQQLDAAQDLLLALGPEALEHADLAGLGRLAQLVDIGDAQLLPDAHRLFRPQIGHAQHGHNAVGHLFGQFIKLGDLAGFQQLGDGQRNALADAGNALQLALFPDAFDVPAQLTNRLGRILEGDDAKAIGIEDLKAGRHDIQQFGHVTIGVLLAAHKYVPVNYVPVSVDRWFKHVGGNDTWLL